MTIVLASYNKNKIKEIGELLAPLNIEIKGLLDFGLYDIEETESTFEENAKLKARFAFEKTFLPALADDSGFCIDVLNNFPGVFSARFASSCGGYDKAFDVLNGRIGNNRRKAYFETAISFIYKNKNEVEEKIFKGRIDGEFVYPPKGKNGFGYCSVFKPNGMDATFAQMSDQDRIKINHRAIALDRFLEFLKVLK